MPATQSLAEYLKTNEYKGFNSEPRYFAQGDYLTYFVSEERCYSVRVNDVLTIYTGIESGQVVGCKLKGFRRSLAAVLSSQTLEVRYGLFGSKS